VCAFLSSYPIAMGGGGLAALGAIIGLFSGFVWKGVSLFLFSSLFASLNPQVKTVMLAFPFS
jgi:hypothetical protein